MDRIKDQIVNQQIKECIEVINDILGSKVLGIYLYGSMVVGGLKKYSDIDLFVVLEYPLSKNESLELIKNFLQISGIYMQGEKAPLEITMVIKAEVNPWNYPPRCEFQYGEWLRAEIEQGKNESLSSNEMPDLAVIITQILLSSKTLQGPDSKILLPSVPYKDFVQAMLQDLDRLILEINSDTRNVLLTLARIWSTLKTNEIRSKPDAADWAIERLPKTYKPVLSRAKSTCIGLEQESWNDIASLLDACANFMLKKIKGNTLEDLAKNSDTKIRLAQNIQS